MSMALIGKAAMLLFYDIPAPQVEEHDDWHTHEHMPERLSIPGFVRGTRWTALDAGPRYFAIYEVAELGVLASLAYLERLNNPTPWTTQMMVHFRGMCRGFCRLTGSAGDGLGGACLAIRCKPQAGREVQLRDRIADSMLPGLAMKRGIASAHLFESGLTPAMTGEQKIRGKDAAVDWALVVTGYDAASVAAVAEQELGGAELERAGAAGERIASTYRLDYAIVPGAGSPRSAAA